MKTVDPKKIKKLDMTYENIRLYKSKSRGLSRVRTGTDYRGFIYLNESYDVIGFINMRKSDQYIQAMEVNRKYQYEDIGKLLLEDLIKIGTTKIAVNKNSNSTVSLCESFFIIQENSNDRYIMSLKPELMKKSQILTEADEDLSATDYGEMEEVEMEEVSDEELSAEDYSEDETSEEETGEEETSTEDEEMSTGDEEMTDDMGTDEENVEGENINEEQPDNVSDQESQEDTGKNKFLINDFIELFNRVEEINEKLNGNVKINGTRDPRLVQGRRNMEKLRDVLYDYITTRFEHETYVANLYQFNLIIQAINVNTALLSNGFKNEEKDNKKAKKRKK